VQTSQCFVYTGLGLALHGLVQSDALWHVPFQHFIQELKMTSHILVPDWNSKTSMHSRKYNNCAPCCDFQIV